MPCVLVISAWRTDCWWWFLFDMISTLAFVAVLGIFSQNLELQLPIAVALSVLQIAAPLMFRPFADPKLNTVCIVGSVFYLVIELAGMAQVLAKLTKATGEGSNYGGLAIIDAIGCGSGGRRAACGGAARHRRGPVALAWPPPSSWSRCGSNCGDT